MSVVDLFGGPDGWGKGAAELGIHPLGIEIDPVACATRHAAGAPTVAGDVAAPDPPHFSPVTTLIGSPPCPSFSSAGKREGEQDWPLIFDCSRALLDGKDVRSECRAKCADERSILVVEPLRWILALRPRFVALEQVPPVLPYWRWLADELRLIGYGTWAGILEAERYGVPQTRERAILMASADATVEPPRPTHQRYVPGEAARHEMTLEGELLPWISMAEALGWNRDDVAHERGNTKGGTRDGLCRSAGEPSRTVDSRADQIERVGADRPAPTLVGARGFYGNTASSGLRCTYVNGNRPNAARRDKDEPAPTLHFGQAWGDVDWVRERPATTVAGDARIARPGHHGSGDDRDPAARSMTDAVRVTVAEAAVLQGFPPDYPWQGNRTQQFQQIGNAVPPPLAQAILGALLP